MRRRIHEERKRKEEEEEDRKDREIQVRSKQEDLRIHEKRMKKDRRDSKTTGEERTEGGGGV